MLNSVFAAEELEILQSIYLDELQVDINDRYAEMKVTIHPYTANNDEEKFVCLTLIFRINTDYPASPPDISLKSPRGLSEPHLASIIENLKSLASSRVDECMIYELIEYAKDSLTDNNFPSCMCPICWEHFEIGDDFFRTQCYHYFHKYCIKKYLKSPKEDSTPDVCPVCRAVMQHDFDLESDSDTDISKNSEEMESFEPSEDYKKWIADCKLIFEKQKKKGGIIDIEAEKNRIHISSSSNSVSSLQQHYNENSVLTPTISSNNNLADVNRDLNNLQSNPLPENNLKAAFSIGDDSIARQQQNNDGEIPEVNKKKNNSHRKEYNRNHHSNKNYHSDNKFQKTNKFRGKRGDSSDKRFGENSKQKPFTSGSKNQNNENEKILEASAQSFDKSSSRTDILSKIDDYRPEESKKPHNEGNENGFCGIMQGIKISETKCHNGNATTERSFTNERHRPKSKPPPQDRNYTKKPTFSTSKEYYHRDYRGRGPPSTQYRNKYKNEKFTNTRRNLQAPKKNNEEFTEEIEQ